MLTQASAAHSHSRADDDALVRACEMSTNAAAFNVGSYTRARRRRCALVPSLPLLIVYALPFALGILGAVPDGSSRTGQQRQRHNINPTLFSDSAGLQRQQQQSSIVDPELLPRAPGAECQPMLQAVHVPM